jgi:hypothetical protein
MAGLLPWTSTTSCLGLPGGAGQQEGAAQAGSSVQLAGLEPHGGHKQRHCGSCLPCRAHPLYLDHGPQVHRGQVTACKNLVLTFKNILENQNTEKYFRSWLRSRI